VYQAVFFDAAAYKTVRADGIRTAKAEPLRRRTAVQRLWADGIQCGDRALMPIRRRADAFA
jgi:hypothetical protein